MSTPLSREAQLLVLTAGGSASDADARRLMRGIDWPRLAALAQREGATAILWQWLQRAGSDGVPPDVAAQWQKRAMVSTFQLLHLERLLHDALQVLSARGIDAMLLKGTALAYTVYGTFAERPMGDIDLLVRAERAEEAWSLLQSQGWQWPSGQWPRERYAKHQHLPPLANARGGAGGAVVVLEIHDGLLPGGHPFNWPTEAVWQDARRSTVNGRPVVLPHPLHELLHVCLHFAWSHEMQWGSWRMLRDIDALARRGGVDWTAFVALARETRATTCCYWTLRLARRLAGAPIPDAVLRALRPPRPEFLLRRLEDHYRHQLFATESTCPSERLGNALWTLGVAPQWSRHGPARPWHVSERWTAGFRHPPGERVAGWRRVMERARHAARTIRYLGRFTTSGRFPPPASGAPTSRCAL